MAENGYGRSIARHPLALALDLEAMLRAGCIAVWRLDLRGLIEIPVAG
jgi:hypothetical protein